MDLKYTIHQIIVIFTNIYMVTSGCQGGFIERHRSCRPKECQTQASFRPTQNCIDRNKKEWDDCRLKLKPKFTSSRGVSESVGGHISTLSMLSTGLAETSNGPVLNVSILYNKTYQDMDLVVNMTSVNGMPGDPYYYWLPDQRTVHLPTEIQNKAVKIMLSYRAFDTCSWNCTLHGCFLYVLHLIPLSLEHMALTYHITVFNITKNANLPNLNLGWKSAIAVAVYPLEGVVHVVFEPLPSRLVTRQISYLIDLHKYPESYELVEPVKTHKIPENATLHTHTFHGIKEGEYYVEVHCVNCYSNPLRNPWSRSQPFSVPPMFPTTGENRTNPTEEGVSKSHIFTSLIIVAALGVIIFSTVCIFILHRKFPASGHKQTMDAVLIDETGNNPRQVPFDEYGNNYPPASFDENGNSYPQLEETACEIMLMNRLEPKFLKLCED